MKVIIEWHKGAVHDTYAVEFPCNYGYVEDILHSEGRYQDAYIMGIDEPLTTFCGKKIAVIRRQDKQEIWVMAKGDKVFTKAEITEKTWFLERWFDSEVILED